MISTSRRLHRHLLCRCLPVVALLLLAPACTDTVFRDRFDFPDPPGGAAGFLGYDERRSNLTVCGNCHVGQQAAWELTAHADAWQTLEESGLARESCEGCHTVNERGNASEQEVGWVATGDPRYHDVQCESCHGPGDSHVANPDAGQPLAPLAVGPDLTQGCGECHQGTHHPFVEEWVQSPHAHVVSAAAGRAECQSCHWGQGILSSWGVKAEYMEKGSSELLPITCGVCHDPHSSEFEGQLRFPVQTASIEEHLCARCHNRRTSPDPSSSHGLEPHAPESALLVGDAGWFPPGSIVDQIRIRGTHGTEANPGLCATCHVARFEVTDRETGDFVFQATGHLFRAIPCLGPDGIPTPDTDCALSTSARSFAGCTESGCHGTADAALSALVTSADRIQRRSDELLSQLERVDGNLEAAGGPIDPTNPTFTTAEGAFFNWTLAHHGGGDVRASTVHNPFLTEALLVASIQAVRNEYGVSPSAAVGVDWEAELRAILRRAGH